jgi:uncharacterized protein involved in exopolysaccharide biosynthesis
MTRPPRSVVGSITGWGVLGRFRNRALAFGVPIAVFAFLAGFPERYLAVATLAPTDPGSLGLGGTLGQLGASSSVFGNQAAIEVAMNVGASQNVREVVIKQAHLEQRLDKPFLDVQRWLARHIEVRSLRGGIIQIEMQNRDPDLAKDIVAAYTSAIRGRLSEISRQQTSYKRDILEQLVREATKGLAQAQARYDTYRLQHQDAIPEVQTAKVAERIGSLEGAIRSNRISLSIAHQMYTDNNFKVQELNAETAALENQLIEAKATSPSNPQSVGSVVASTTVLYQLQRELGLQRALYDSYMRFLQGTSVEDLASTANMRILEPPHIDSERQIWLPGMAMAVAIAILWGAVEFYRLRPPLGVPVPAAEWREAAVRRPNDDEAEHV